ncbi:MAG: alpha-amylase family glycosyl hydrolase [Bacilli bacterium]|nr:alpha-amylase family glycosyl hydrolase [Bacilli bacterium]
MKIKNKLTLAIMSLLLLVSCNDTSSLISTEPSISESTSEVEEIPNYELVDRSDRYIDSDNYRNFYHIFVHSFADSNGDGIGDLKGISDKLDYLRRADDPYGYDSLGINGIYLSPIQEAASYHGYDIIDYESINPNFGNMTDFDNLVAGCHQRGIKIILDLVLNHTSTLNEYFIKAVQALTTDFDKDSFDENGRPTAELVERHPEVDYFRFINKNYNFTYSGYSNRLYNVTGDWNFEGFSSGMPDWNLENETVRALHKEYMEFWLKRGVDGFRLDAVQSFYGENKIDLAKNYEYIDYINDVTKQANPKAYIVAEGPWSMVGCKSYIQNTAIDSYFNFDTGYLSLARYNGGYINGLRYDSLHLNNIQEFLALSGIERKLNDQHIDAYFNSNHDIGRITNQFGFKGNLYLPQLKFHIALQNMFEGNYFLYYGDEIGLMGVKDGDDDRPCRSPFLWGDNYTTTELKAGINDRTQLYFEPENVQKDDPNSLLNFVSHVFRVKDYHPSIARGQTSLAYTDEENKIIVLDKTYEADKTYLVINFGTEAKEMTMDKISATGEITNCLTTNGKYAKVEGGNLTIPALSITVIE